MLAAQSRSTTQVAGLPAAPILYIVAGGDHSLVVVQRAGPGELMSVGELVGSPPVCCAPSKSFQGPALVSMCALLCENEQCLAEWFPLASQRSLTTAAFVPSPVAGPSHLRPHGESALPLPLPNLRQLIGQASAAAGRGEAEDAKSAELWNLCAAIEAIFSCPAFLIQTMSGTVSGAAAGSCCGIACLRASLWSAD